MGGRTGVRDLSPFSVFFQFQAGEPSRKINSNIPIQYVPYTFLIRWYDDIYIRVDGL